MSGQAINNQTIQSRSLSAEQQLLLCCARSQVDAEQAARIKKLVARELDWEYLLLFAQKHALAPLLYWQLNANAREGVPPVYFNRLREKFRANTARNLFLTSELCRILRLFEKSGVPVLPYKGPALAIAAYGNLNLRSFVDLDILVRKCDVLRAKELLISEGYRPEPYLTEAQQSVMLRSQHNLPFVRAGKIIVELHWVVAARKFSGGLDVRQMWERAVNIVLAGETVKNLSAEDTLLSLCVHGSKHLWERLAWICDVAELVNASGSLDWRRVVAQASATGSERMLYLGLRLAAELAGANLPLEVREKVEADSSASRLSTEVFERLFFEQAEPASILRNMVFNLRARRRLRDKISYFQFLFMPTDGDLVLLRLPTPLTFIYYMIRPFRMLLKSGLKN